VLKVHETSSESAQSAEQTRLMAHRTMVGLQVFLAEPQPGVWHLRLPPTRLAKLPVSIATIMGDWLHDLS
jgi:hypothetical protein